jgi:hypothetical protein
MTTEDRILDILNDIAEDIDNKPTKAELVDVIKYQQREWIKLNNQKQVESSQRAIDAADKLTKVIAGMTKK